MYRLFFSLGVFAFYSLRARLYSRLAWVCVLGLVVGSISEIFQLFTARGFSFADIALNVCSALVAGLILTRFTAAPCPAGSGETLHPARASREQTPLAVPGAQKQ